VRLVDRYEVGTQETLGPLYLSNDVPVETRLASARSEMLACITLACTADLLNSSDDL
jgi:hypothetical protein